ncbi:DUF6965 family protein [Taibaiella helva]|uniref:DUF6965 family protein n=1 Tax=Taibaiella helva TaxID=2301235 RepID=UPI000E57BE81|nr:hypothetical protein [Taibaiella helva]
MIKQHPQHPEVLKEADRLQHFFDTTPILIQEWREGCMFVRNIPEFIHMELHAARTFNPTHYFNPPLRRLQQLEKAILNQTGAPATNAEA